MDEATRSNTPEPPKLKRSRNGCSECRRLHRRCDEAKPECQTCREVGKPCSYQKKLSWGGRPFKKSAFKQYLGMGVVEIPLNDQAESSGSRSFVYGQLSRALSSTDEVPAQKKKNTTYTHRQKKPTNEALTADVCRCSRITHPEQSTVSSVSLPWLSQHHRMLFDHFINATVPIFTKNKISQPKIRTAFIPMAADANHSFSLLAAVLSLASTHRINLGLHQNIAEIDYWLDMSVGHLRRPMVQEDESAANCFAATALILCVRDIISDSDRPFSWKLHLQGALAVLSGKKTTKLTGEEAAIRAPLKKLAGSLLLRRPLSISLSPREPGGMDDKRIQVNGGSCGIPDDLTEILQEIRGLRVDKLALQNMEISAGRMNMQPLWASLRGKALDLVCRLGPFTESETTGKGESEVTHRLFGHIGLLQIYSAVLDLPVTDTGVRNTLEAAVSLLQNTDLVNDTRIGSHLVFPLFTLGCLMPCAPGRTLIGRLLTRVKDEHGKKHAGRAKGFLEELWARIDAQDRPVRQADVEALIAEKEWELSLW